jgi:hypothetical protein
MSKALRVAVVAALLLAVSAASASARKPIIAYVEGGQFKLYDAELSSDVAAPPIPVAAAGFRFGISRNGRYVFYNDDAKKLHLYDRNSAAAVPLPGIDVYANPAFLSVSDAGLLAFDQNVNGPTVVYNSGTGQFVDTGLVATNKNRQPQLSPGGGLLITTCDGATDCPAPTANSDPFLQNLGAMTNTAIGAGAVDAAKDEEDPCISAGGAIVGWQKVASVDKDVFLYDRATAAFIATTNLSDPNNDDDHCVIDRGGAYVGLMSNNAFKLYDVAADAAVPLPAKPFESSNNYNAIFSEPFTPAPKTMPAPVPSPVVASKRRKCKRKKHRATAAKKRCKRKKRKR